MRVLSTFSGISAASVAWKPLGFEFAGYCEPAAFQSHVLNARCDATAPKYLPQHPDFAPKKYSGISGGAVVNFGDVTAITDDDLRALGPVDVLEGGSPCQAFSISGLRKGLGDDRGNLTLAFAQLAARMREINGLRFVVWENVKGVLSDETNAFGCLLSALADPWGGEDALVPAGKSWPRAGHVVSGDDDEHPDVTIAWRVLDSQFFGVPQRRERVFVVASFDELIDAGSVLAEFDGQEWNPAARREAQQEDTAAGPAGAGITGLDVIHPSIVGTLCASGAGLSRPAGQGNELDFVVVHHPQVVGTLQTGKPKGSSGSDLDFTIVHDGAGGELVCRRLMPLECERLQGFPDGYTDVAIGEKPATDGNRYKALGNSMSVPVMEFVGYRLLKAVEAAEKAKKAHKKGSVVWLRHSWDRVKDQLVTEIATGRQPDEPSWYRKGSIDEIEARENAGQKELF